MEPLHTGALGGFLIGRRLEEENTYDKERNGKSEKMRNIPRKSKNWRDCEVCEMFNLMMKNVTY